MNWNNNGNVLYIIFIGCASLNMRNRRLSYAHKKQLNYVYPSCNPIKSNILYVWNIRENALGLFGSEQLVKNFELQEKRRKP